MTPYRAEHPLTAAACLPSPGDKVERPLPQVAPENEAREAIRDMRKHVTFNGAAFSCKSEHPRTYKSSCTAQLSDSDSCRQRLLLEHHDFSPNWLFLPSLLNDQTNKTFFMKLNNDASQSTLIKRRMRMAKTNSDTRTNNNGCVDTFKTVSANCSPHGASWSYL